ncbi:aspartyl protease family protein [Myroides phaeus]|uniref:PDZ domain (Also known as DHR or GLGF) n=1 Tax=Myroides phaeus TaxID=702745 RepID=A0A1G8EB43_9FLAO|nr:aspartyl protease family protein [Myroides phaeus]SDH67128.1 PDZ domain (Also known as DHR or GLGF) [Myroides phaeus]
MNKLKIWVCGIFLSGLSLTMHAQNINKLINKTTIDQKDFKITFPIEVNGASIFVKPTIKGKEYKMLFDTGAVTTISSEMKESLRLKSIKESKVYDIDDKSNKMMYVKIDTLSLEGINFYNVAAIDMDHKAVVAFKCKGFDGILGANVLRKVVWQIDMKAKTITFSNALNSLKISPNIPQIKLYIGVGGVPSITTYIGKEKVYNTVLDYGFDGGISMNSSLFIKLLKNKKDVKYIEGIGSTLTGLYGDVIVPRYYTAVIDDLKIGDVIVPKDYVFFNTNYSRSIGASFLRNYKVTLSWKEKTMWLEPHERVNKEVYKGFGYRYALRGNNVYINSIYKNSEAAKKGLQLGDQIVAINGVSYTDLNSEEQCKVLYSERGFTQDITIKRGEVIINKKLEMREMLTL